MNREKAIDIIVPCYNEEQNIGIFYEEMERVREELEDYEFNYIFVDDGSIDNTLVEIKRIAAAADIGSKTDNCQGAGSGETDSRRNAGCSVKYISFSRNFGKEAAMYAGIRTAAGTKSDMAVIMDADLQHPPALLKEMIIRMEYSGISAGEEERGAFDTGKDKCSCGERDISESSDAEYDDEWAIFDKLNSADYSAPGERGRNGSETVTMHRTREKCDCVAARRVTRLGEPRIRSTLARAFYKIMNRYSDIEIVDGAVDFRLMSKRMVRAIASMPETQRFSKGIFAWVGFRTEWVEFENVRRFSGESKWTLWSLLKYAVDGFIDFANSPLKVLGAAGGIIAAGSALYFIAEIIKILILGKDTPGYASTICLILFFGGIIIAMLGVIGEYIGRMYMETKCRPVYIEKESNIHGDD